MRRKRQRGNAYIEFTLCWIFLLPFLTGMVATSVMLMRTVQTAQVARDAGHMFARWVDFSVNSNKDIIVRLASGLGLTRAGGNGIVYLTQVMWVDDAQCASVPAGTCTNNHKYVILKRVTIGNTSLRASNYGTPNSGLLGADGGLVAGDYLRDASAVVPANAVLPTLAGGEFAYVSEALFQVPDMSLPFADTGGITYAHSIF